MTASRRDWLLLAVCVLGAACMWSRFGVIDRIPEAFSDVVKTPHGIFSDLYPRWLGARELLLRGRNPYGAEVTREIQEGFYGRSIRRPGIWVWTFPVAMAFSTVLLAQHYVVDLIAGWYMGPCCSLTVFSTRRTLKLNLPRPLTGEKDSQEAVRGALTG